jgi:hypothetical protein
VKGRFSAIAAPTANDKEMARRQAKKITFLIG